MPEFTPEEKEYIRRYILSDLEDQIGLAPSFARIKDEDEILSSIVSKLKELTQ